MLRKQRALLNRVAGRWKRRLVASAFDRWWEAARDLAKQRNLVAKVAARWSRRHTARAFDRWFDWSHEMRRAVDVIERVGARWQNMCAARSFGKWATTTMELKRTRTLLTRVATRWRDRFIASAFATWHSHAAELRRLRVILARVTGRWSRRVIARAFDRWFDWSHEMRRAAAVVGKIALRWRTLALSRAWDKWRAEASFSVSTSGMLVRQVAARLVKRQMAAGFARWARVTSWSVESRRTLKRVVRRMRLFSLRHAWDGWLDSIESKARMQLVLQKAVVRWNARHLVQSFHAWADRCDEMAAARTSVTKVLSAWRSKTLFKCFRRWTDFASQRSVLVTKLDRIMGRWENRRVASAFDRWVEAVGEIHRMRRLLTRVSKKMSQNLLARALESWVQYTARARIARAICARITNRGVATAWHTWLDAVDGARRSHVRSDRATAMAARLSLRLRAKAFREWRASHQWGGFVNRIVARNVERMTVKNLRGYIHRWIECVEEKKEQVEELKRCLTRKRVAQRWFLRWYWDAFDSDIQSALANILGSTETAMDEAFSPDGKAFPPSAIRGVRPLPRADSPFSDDGAGDAYMSGDDLTDSPLSDDSADALGAAADKLFARGARISMSKDGDVRMARELLGSGGGARARRDNLSLVPAEEDSSSDTEEEVVEAVETRPAEHARPGLESFSSKYDRVMKGV